MLYLQILIALALGASTSALVFKSRLEELKNLRYNYLLAQEEETRFLKHKVLEVELSLHNFKKYVESKETRSTP